MRGSLIYPPQTGVHKTMRKDGRERERKRGLDPNQFRPTDLPRGFPGRPAQVVSPMPDAGRSSGLRALRLSPPSYVHRFPAPKSQCVSWIRSRLPLRGSPGVAPGSLLLSENTQRTSMGRSLLWHPIFVNRDITGRGMILVHQRDVADEARKLPLGLPDVQLPRLSWARLNSINFEQPHAIAFARSTNRRRH